MPANAADAPANAADAPANAADAPANVAASTHTQAQYRGILADAAAKSPDDPALQMELALYDLRVNDPPDGERGLIAVWRRFPGYARAPYRLGTYYLARGLHDRAVAPLRAAADLAPADASIQSAAAMACLKAGQLPLAQRYAQSAIRTDPGLGEPYLVLAHVLSRHNAIGQAISATNQYLERSPNQVPGFVCMGEVYARAGDVANAQRWLKRAAEADPGNGDRWLALAQGASGAGGTPAPAAVQGNAMPPGGVPVPGASSLPNRGSVPGDR